MADGQHRGGAQPPLWPHQERGLDQVLQLIAQGVREAICVTAPTGGGKTRLMAELVAWATTQRWPVVLFTNKRLLTGQAHGTLTRMGIEHGVMADGYDAALLRSVQVASMQTINARVFDSKKWRLPRGRLILIDEAHSNKGEVGQKVIRHYLAEGAVVVGFSASPVGLGGLYGHLVTAGTKKELRACGALVKCLVFAPDEPGLQGVQRTKVGEYTEDGVNKSIMQTLVFGNVFKQWLDLNPQRKPTILWAPGVRESRWFVGQWEKLGVRAAHIDGETENDERERIFRENREGRLPVLCSMGVLREGVDLPWLYHGILCQACLEFQTFVQIVGRLLRAHPGKDHCILQDHAGAWWRHGSPNADREWKLDDTAESIRRERRDGFESGKEREPIRCPRCSGVRASGRVCPFCSFEHEKSVRMVRMSDGTLKSMVGQVHKVSETSNEEREWKKCLFACANGRRPMTFRQVAGMYTRRTGQQLPPGLPLTPPAGSVEWDAQITEVYPWLRRKRS
jgi:DNA repair protein RadD